MPGSQGPRHSGSVTTPTSHVFTPTDRVLTKSCSTGAAIVEDGEKYDGRIGDEMLLETGGGGGAGTVNRGSTW